MANRYRYDVEISDIQDWPSITVDWLPGENFSVHSVILGTHAGDSDNNYLMLADIRIPHTPGSAHAKVDIMRRIHHDGEVHRARHMPQNPVLIATKTVSSEVYLFNYPKHSVHSPLDDVCNPDLRLRGHSAEGYGLSWNPFKPGHLLSGSDDSLICLWDINASPNNKALDAMETFKVHQGVVEDVAWHRMHDFIFGSVGEDKKLYLWDLRTPSATKSIHSVVAHQSMIHGLSFNPFNEWVVATGSSDKTAKVFDFRMFHTPLHTFTFPNDAVYQVGWCPTKQSILASSYLGSELMVWDLNRINEIQTAEEAAQGPPELLFIHRGHTGKISDFSWNPHELGMIASVGEDHLLQIWQMAKNTYNLDGLPGHAITDCITISD